MDVKDIYLKLSVDKIILQIKNKLIYVVKVQFLCVSSNKTCILSKERIKFIGTNLQMSIL